jgi:L-lactate dehydrogenase complex protein LldF
VTVGGFSSSPPFPEAAATFIPDAQLRANLRRATATIRAKRNRVIGELADFDQLRRAAAAIKDDALGRLDQLLEELEANVTRAGGHVHFAESAAAANRVIVEIVERRGAREVVKVKSMTTAETGLNQALAEAGIDAAETDLAELIVQLGDDLPSHIVVPAIHRNRAEVREIFLQHMGEHGLAAPSDLSDEPAALAAAARAHLRARFLRAEVAISGANFAIADSGSLAVVESEGNGRMCLTLPKTLISLVGIDKVLPSFRDLEVFLQLLARSSTGERMSPYTSVFTGVSPGDGPAEFHLVLLDNGRSKALADRVGRQALRCIRCAACLNVCPVYERVGGHAYGSVYPGPIGAVLTPQLDGVATDPVTAALPFASTLCGACYEVCPVAIDIPRLLVHLRGRVVDRERAEAPGVTDVAMAAAGFVLSSPQRLDLAERAAGFVAGRLFGRGPIGPLPGPLRRWTAARDAPVPPRQSFREWWRTEHQGSPGTSAVRPEPEHPHDRGGPRPITGRALAAEAVRAVSRRFRRHRPAPVASSSPQAEAGPDERAALLASVRQALDSAPLESEVKREYQCAGQSGVANPLERFCERVSDYRAQVFRVTPEAVGETVADVLGRATSSRVVVPADIPDEWLPHRDRFTVQHDYADLSAPELDGFHATVSGCALAIAETGTIVLDGGARQGRRALSLVPDHLVVIVFARQVVGGVPDAVAELDPRTPQTWISGPSATSDIELNRVEGVHGPRRLDVVVVA